jgi:hypothetical protein
VWFFVSGEKDVPQNFFRGQYIGMSACLLQRSPEQCNGLSTNRYKYKITKHNSHIIYMSSGLQSFVLKLHDRVYRILFVE